MIQKTTEKQNNSLSDKLLKEMHDAASTVRDPQGKAMPAPPEGSLALLALGYRGLAAWRKAKRENGLDRYAFAEPIGPQDGNGGENTKETSENGKKE